MKHSFLFIIFTFSFLYLTAQNNIQVEEYQLDNGLTVMLNPDPFANRVFGAVAVNAGGSNDPADATGIAHYLEHLLFKGTTEMGTADFEKEKPHLDSINILYDQLAVTTDEATQQQLQKEINRHALEASKYGLPNEFDKLLKGIGSTAVNAFTSEEMTFYHNSFPPHQIIKWLDLYSHRFAQPVFRSFQSELEVVYEEKNRAMDDFQRKIFEDFSAEVFEGHPYGTQTVLGSVEHLKKPSLNKMYEFFNTYYVPNNMALILTGNFDIEVVKPVIEEKFGSWKAQPLPKSPNYPIKSFEGKESKKGRYTPVKVMLLAQKTVPNGHPDEAALEIASSLLYNYEETGLLNKLQLDGKLLYTESQLLQHNEDGANMLIVVPKILFQSFGQAQKLVFAEIEKLKKGTFSDQLFSSTKHLLAQNFDRQLEDVTSRGILMGYTFNQGKTWEEYARYRERIEKVSKEKVMEVAQKYFTDDYFALYSRMGFPKKTKLDKPDFKPVVTKQDKSSVYAAQFEQLETLKQTPKFIDFEKDVAQLQLKGGNQLFVAKNPINQVFSLDIQYWVGKAALNDLPIITSMLNYSGTSDKELKSLKEAFAQLGVSYYFSSNNNFFTINLSGEEKNLGAALTLVDELMTNSNFDDDAKKLVVNEIKTAYKVDSKSPSTIGRAMRDYVMYANRSPYLDRPNAKEVKSKSFEELRTGLADIRSYAASLHYTGNQSATQVKEIITENFDLKDTDKKADWYYPESDLPKQNTIYIINDKKAVQSQIWYAVEGKDYSLDEVAKREAFAQYFGGGFSGLALQEIREYRSLAYSTGAYYITSNWQQGKKGNFIAFIGCQADKTLDAIKVMNDLITDMPRYEDRMPNLVESLKNRAFTQYPSFRAVSKEIERYQTLGLEEDLGEIAYGRYDDLSFDDIQQFYEATIKGKPITITIYGDTKQMDMEALAKIGKVVELRKEDVIKK